MWLEDNLLSCVVLICVFSLLYFNKKLERERSTVEWLLDKSKCDVWQLHKFAQKLHKLTAVRKKLPSVGSPGRHTHRTNARRLPVWAAGKHMFWGSQSQQQKAQLSWQPIQALQTHPGRKRQTAGLYTENPTGTLSFVLRNEKMIQHIRSHPFWIQVSWMLK